MTLCVMCECVCCSGATYTHAKLVLLTFNKRTIAPKYPHLKTKPFRLIAFETGCLFRMVFVHGAGYNTRRRNDLGGRGVEGLWLFVDGMKECMNE